MSSLPEFSTSPRAPLHSPNRLMLQLHKHHRTLASVALLTFFGGFGATAFGVGAINPPELDAIPIKLVAEKATPNNVAEQLEKLAAQNLILYRSQIARSNDSPETMLRRLGVNDPQALAFFRKDATAKQIVETRGNKMLQAQIGADARLLELIVRYEDPKTRIRIVNTKDAGSLENPSTVVPDQPMFNRLTLRREDNGWTSRLETLPLMAQIRLSSGSLAPNFLAATQEAQLPESVVSQVADIFSDDMNLRARQSPRNAFSIVYETLTADGEPVAWGKGAGRVLAAELRMNDHTSTAFWYQTSDGPGTYYNQKGQSRRHAFLTDPMEFTRISSGFGERFHPIHKTWKQHRGVDYAASIGTPVRTVGEGVVEFTGEQNGYGKVIRVRHSQNRTSLYAHLNQIDVKVGQTVEQGEFIGESGATGWVTGPHLHFEFLVNGEHQDPQKVLQSETHVLQLPDHVMANFKAQAEGYKKQLSAAASQQDHELTFE